MKPFLLLAIFAYIIVGGMTKPQSSDGFFPDNDDEKVESASKQTLTFPEDSSELKPNSINSESEKAIDVILSATREGRQLNLTDGRYSQILSDPSVKEKLASASEVEARGFIHDKLCSIGLCDNNYNGGYGHQHSGGHGLGSAVKHVQLVQPVAVKPIGGPIPAIQLESAKHHHQSSSYGPPSVPPFGAFGNRPGPGFGGASGGSIYNPLPKPGGPQIYPSQGPSFGPAPFKPNYGHYGQGQSIGHSPILPITKPLNTHVHHHIHHNQPGVPILDGGFEGGFDGYYGAAQKSSVSLATPAGKALGSYTQAQTLNPSYAKKCVCIPAEQCYIESSGTQQNQAIQGTGIPNNGFVGFGIDPRNLKPGHGIESNSTDSEEFESTTTSDSDIPDSPSETHSRKRRDEDAILKANVESEPRQLNYGSNPPRSCQPGFVCCQNQDSQQHYPSPSSPNNNFVDYNSGRFPQTSRPQQQFGQCGKRQTEGINGRVISGGNSGSTLSIDGETSFGDYPWHVAILKNDGFVCSGSLIDSYHIITAAHCIKRLTAPELRVRLGEWDVNHETEFYPFVEIQVETILINPNYYAGNLVNDVAILRLVSSVDFPRTPHISPICLPPPNLDFTGQRCFVSGWGKDAFGAHGKFQNVLKEVDLPVLSHFDCEQKLKRTKLGYDFSLDKGFVCAGGEALKDACKGDGGGGLVCDIQGTWYLAGVVSWGVSCGLPDVPGVYAKISQYTPWIQQNTGILH